MSKRITHFICLCLLLWSLPTAVASDELHEMPCIPCTGATPAMKGEELQAWVEVLGGGWTLIGEHHIEKDFEFDSFVDALAYANVLGGLAETNGHHPTIVISYNVVKVLLWTYKINGLSESDFIMAAKIDALFF